jgi:DNA-binding response OmpR family regulator
MKLNVLVVDDGKDIADLVKTILDFADFECNTRTSYELNEALEIIGQEGTALDLLITDFDLGNGSGGDLTSAFAKTTADRKNAETKIIVMSASFVNRGDEIRKLCRADGYIEKPFGLREILELVRTVLNGKIKETVTT